MTVSIQLFASLKDAAKASQISVEIPDGSSVAQLLEDVFKFAIACAGKVVC